MADVLEFTKEYSEDAEQGVLAAILLDPDTLARVRPLLDIGDFFADRHRHMYRAMLAIADRRDVVDPITLSTQLGDADVLAKVGGKEYIGFLLDAVPTAGNAEYHAGIVVERAKRRAAAKVLDDGAQLLREGSITAAQMAERLRPALDALATERGAKARGGPLSVRSDAELEAMPAMQWLAEGILPLGGLAALYGAPAAGKSFIALDLVFSIATGAPWLGRDVVPGGALYVAGEGLAGLSQRIVAWKAARDLLGEPVGVGIVSDSINLLDAADVARIVRATEAPSVARPVRLIVIDTLARSMVGGDENDTRDMSNLIAAADRVRHATGAAVLLVHHTRKDSDQERGSSALRGAVDTLILCEDGDDGRQVVCQKQKDAEPFSPISFRLVAGHGSCIVQASGSGSAEDAREQAEAMTPKRLAALRVLREAFTDRGATTTEWLKASSLSERTFYRVRTWLVSEGYVAESARGGRYTVTPSGRSALSNCQPTAKPNCQPLGGPPVRGAAGRQSPSGNGRNGTSMAVDEDAYWGSLLTDTEHARPA